MEKLIELAGFQVSSSVHFGLNVRLKKNIDRNRYLS